MPRRFTTRTAVGITAALALTVPALPAAASAKPKTQRFTAQGLVVASTSDTLKVITRSLKVGRNSLPTNTVVTVKRPASAKSSNVAGYAVTLAGNASGSGKALRLTATRETATTRPAQAFLGVVTATTTNTVKLVTVSAAGGDDFGSELRTVTADISAATSTIDGAAAPPRAGEFAVILGERERDTVVAAAIYGWTEAPDVLAGEITSVSGTTITLSGGWHDDDADPDSPESLATSRRHDGDDSDDDSPDDNPGGDDSGGDDSGGDDSGDTGTSVDLAPDGIAAPIIENGTTMVGPADLSDGERIVLIGAFTADGTFTPTVGFAFEKGNNRPARHHHGH